MSLSSPSPSWFAKTPYCSLRDWTRFLRHRIKKYPDSPVHTLSDSLRIYFFPFQRAYLFFYGFAVEFAGYVWTVAVSGTKKLRIRKYPDTCGRGLKLPILSAAKPRSISLAGAREVFFPLSPGSRSRLRHEKKNLMGGKNRLTEICLLSEKK